ncbi:MAG: DUF721 domain-containing protein [Gammaproteobacteria bacterium]|nr:DUF721 domain-containing protein [Gammaproteobacteria bacterium]
MSTKNPKSIKSLLLDECSAVAALGEQARTHQTLVQHVRDALPDAYRKHIFAAELSDDILTVICDSATWATNVRFYSEKLLLNVAPDHKSVISRVVVKVRPHRRS